MTFRIYCSMPNGHESRGAALREFRLEYERHCEEQMMRYPGSIWQIEDCSEDARYTLIRASVNATGSQT